MSYGIQVFRKEFGLSWMKARRAAKLFKVAQTMANRASGTGSAEIPFRCNYCVPKRIGRHRRRFRQVEFAVRLNGVGHCPSSCLFLVLLYS